MGISCCCEDAAAGCTQLLVFVLVRGLLILGAHGMLWSVSMSLLLPPCSKTPCKKGSNSDAVGTLVLRPHSRLRPLIQNQCVSKKRQSLLASRCFIHACMHSPLQLINSLRTLAANAAGATAIRDTAGKHVQIDTVIAAMPVKPISL
jgi:hypothetical protein